MPRPVELLGGPLAGIVNLWPSEMHHQLTYPDRERAKTDPQLPARWHIYRRVSEDEYAYVRTEEQV
jgi:hypothetical protein